MLDIGPRSTYCENVKNITVSVDDEIYRSVRIVAAERGTSISSLVKRYLLEVGKGASEAERLRQREKILRESITEFRASDRLARGDAHRRDA